MTVAAEKVFDVEIIRGLEELISLARNTVAEQSHDLALECLNATKAWLTDPSNDSFAKRCLDSASAIFTSRRSESSLVFAFGHLATAAWACYCGYDERAAILLRCAAPLKGKS